MGSVDHSALDFDVLIVGAGLSGIYSLYRMRELGLRVKVLEAGSGEGGTWYWNRYPGCRFDSESYSYGFSFSQEVLDEWSWTEHFAPQPETLQYAQFLTDKFDLRGDMQFNTRIQNATWQPDSRSWLLIDTNGTSYSSRFLVTAMGILNEPTLPNIPGVEDFHGEAFHSARWPNEWSLDGKRVGIIGTGATGIQIISAIAGKPLKQLTVFQRTPNWSAPLRNDKIDSNEMAEIRQQYPDIFQRCADSSAGFLHNVDPRKTFEVHEEERLALWEELYSQRGFSKWLGTFGDHLVDRDANAAYSAFHAQKIRERVHDAATAEKLIPKCHGFGTRRVPLETNYFDVYNMPHVRLVDYHADSAISRITAGGVQLESGEDIALDVLIYATGFDAVTGALTNGIDLRGVDNATPGDVWADGIRTYLGLFVHGFPNMAMIMGPHQMFGNVPRSIEFAVDAVARLLRHCRDRGVTYFEASEDEVDKWTEHVVGLSKGMLSNEVDSWMTGVNKNLKGKQNRIVARYNGPAAGYRKRVNDVADRNWEDLILKQ